MQQGIRSLKKLLLLTLCLAVALSCVCAVPTAVSAEDTVIFTDGFDSVNPDVINAAQLKSGDASAPEPAEGSNGWFNVGFCNANGYHFNSPGGLSVVEGPDGGKAIQLGNSNSGIARALTEDGNAPSEPIKSGIYEVSFSAKPSTWNFAVDITGSLDNLRTQASSNSRRPVLAVTTDGTLYISIDSNAVINNSKSWIVGKCDPDKWIQVTTWLNLDENLVKTVVKQDEQIVGQMLRGVRMGKDCVDNGLGYIRFIAQTPAKDKYPRVADVSVKKVTDVPYSGYREDFTQASSANYTRTNLFTDVKTQNALYNSGWELNKQDAKEPTTTTNGINIITEGDEDYIEVVPPEGTSGEYQLQTIVKSNWESSLTGKTYLSARMKVSGTDGYGRILILGDGIPATLEFLPNSKNIYVNGNDDSGYGPKNQINIGTYDPEKWCDINIVLDTDAKEWSVSIKQEGEKKITKSGILVRQTLAEKGIDTVRFPATYGADLKLDSLTIGKTPASAELFDCTMTDVFGEPIENTLTDVSPALQKIGLTFTADMDPESVIGAVKLTKADGSDVEGISVSGSGADYTVDLGDKLLEDNTTYRLTVSKTAASEGKPMPADEAFEFTTGAAEQKLTQSVMSGGTEITDFAALKSAESAVISPAIVNIDNTSLAWVIAYYDGSKKYIGSQTIEKKDLSPRTKITAPQALDKPIPDGAASAKVMLWNSLDDIEPLCDSVELK